ncbi:hypothetical protein Tco_1071942, partial [Tanacetum coccineum]
PTLSTYKADEEEEEKEEEKAEDDNEVTPDQKVSTPHDYELTEEDENQQDDDTMGGEQEDEEDEELYEDLNINLNRRDAEMKDAQSNQEMGEVHMTLTTEPPVVQQQISLVSLDLVSKFINPSPDTGIDLILNPNVQSDISVNVSISATTETPSSDTIIPQSPIPIIQPQQQTHDPTTTTIPTTTMPEIPNFASIFGFECRVSSLESDLSEIKQTNQFDEALSSITGIVDNYLTSKMKDEVNMALQLKSNKLREEAQAENQDFLNSLDSNMNRIIKEQVKAQISKIMTKVEKYVTKTLGAEVLVRSTNQPQTTYAVASSLSELELKKILMDKIEENNSIDRSDVQKNLYRALLEAYNSDKDLISSYGEVVTLKRGRDDQDKDEEPSTGSNLGSKRRRSHKEESSKETTQKKSKSTSSSKGTTRSPPKSSGKSVQEEEHDPRVDDLEEPFHQEFDTGNDDVSPVRELNIQHLTQDLLTGPTYDLIKGTCKSVVELENHLEEVFKATSDQLDWHNPEGRPHPHDLSKSLPLIPDARGRLIIPYEHFINNDLEYLKGGSSSHKYTTSITKTKAADYGHIKWIEDKIPRKGDFKRLCREDIEDMLLLLVQGKLTNLNVDERFTLNVALRMYTRRIVIQERVEDLQLAVESYQKKINLTKPDTYRIDLRKMTLYTAYRDIQGIIYQDDMDRNCLMRTD